AALQRPRFRIVGKLVEDVAVMRSRAIERVTWSTGQREPLQAHAFLSERSQIAGFDLQPAVEILEREIEAFRLAQRLAGLDIRLGAKRGERRLLGQHQQIAEPPRLAREIDARDPRVVLLPELTDVAD